MGTRLAAIHLGLTAAMIVGLAAVFRLARRSACDDQAGLIATAAVVPRPPERQ